MIVVSVVKPNFYQDSLALLRLARELKDGAEVDEVTAMMGTPANKQLLADAGLLTSEGHQAGPNDLVIAVRAVSSADAHGALARAEACFAENRRALAAAMPALPRTLDSALRHRPATNLALISLPGRWAAAEARGALRRGLHVMLFSDNVPVEDEIALKREALNAGRLLMGPDCGTAILNGVFVSSEPFEPRRGYDPTAHRIGELGPGGRRAGVQDLVARHPGQHVEGGSDALEKRQRAQDAISGHLVCGIDAHARPFRWTTETS